MQQEKCILLILFQFLGSFFFSFYLIFRIFAIFCGDWLGILFLLNNIHFKRTKVMNKTDLIAAMAASGGMAKADAAKALNAFMEAVADALKKGDKVTLVGFGTFSVTERAARTGVNPATKQMIEIPAKKVVKFKAGSELSFD